MTNNKPFDEQPFSFDLSSGNGAVTVFLEMEQVGQEQVPTGRFVIDMKHKSGPYQFFMEVEPEESWSATGNCPEFLDQGIINEIGDGITEHISQQKE